MIQNPGKNPFFTTIHITQKCKNSNSENVRNENKIEDEGRKKFARPGVLALGKKVETPEIITETRLGTPPFLTADLLQKISLPMVLVDFADMFAWGDLSPQTEQQPVRKKAGLPSNLGQPAIVLTQRTPLRPVVAGSQGSKEVYLDTPIGRKPVTSSLYAAQSQALKPDIVVALCDEIPLSMGRNRQKKAVEVSNTWLVEQVANVSKSNGTLNDSAKPEMWGVVLGGKNADLRQLSIQSLVENNCTGAVLGGIGLGESFTDLKELLPLMVEGLPAHLPRMASGNWGPLEMLEAVMQGVDLVGSCYNLTCTEAGRAMVFPLTVEEMVKISCDQEIRCEDGKESCEKGSSPNDIDECQSQNQSKKKRRKVESDAESFKAYEKNGLMLNLWESSYVEDTSPLMENCDCLACADHTRSYIHHLLIAHEILAKVLLYVHNVNHSLKFFRSIRSMLSLGDNSNLETYKNTFEGICKR